jgi:hypothetical protein
VQVEGPLVLHQLAEELAGVIGPDSSLSCHGDPLVATEETPALLWVDGVTAQVSGVLEAVRAHEPDPGWTSRRSMPAHLSIDVIRAKAARREMLTADELQVAVRHLLG